MAQCVVTLSDGEKLGCENAVIVSHSEVTQVAQSDSIGTELGRGPALRSGREVFLTNAWPLPKVPRPNGMAQCGLADSQVSDEEPAREKFLVGQEHECVGSGMSVETLLFGERAHVGS